LFNNQPFKTKKTNLQKNSCIWTFWKKWSWAYLGEIG